MEYRALVDLFNSLEETSATLEKRQLLADFLADVDPGLLPKIIRLTLGGVFAPQSSADLGMSESLALDAIAKATGIDTDRLESWWREEGDLGDATALAVSRRSQQPLAIEPLSVERVYGTLRRLGTFEGEGSQGKTVGEVAGLISDAAPDESRYVVRSIVGPMRLGVGEGIVRDAIAEAFLDGSEEAVRAVEAAYEVTNDLAIVAERARAEGRAGLDRMDVQLFRPVKSMLAHKADDLTSALADLRDAEGEVLVETKYDGIRAQIHRDEEPLRVFTRRLEDVTEQFPDVVAAVDEHVQPRTFILEAEVVGYDRDGTSPVPFQNLSRRIKRKYRIEELIEEVPVTVHCYDVLYLEGRSQLDVPLRRRIARLEGAITPSAGRLERADNVRTSSLETATSFFEAVVAAGHEGVMVKNLDATYQPGSRVGYQLKVKATMEPLDLVVTRAKWSEGRKSDFIGRPYLACRTVEGELREVGRMHTGFTDRDLEEFTELVTPRIEAVDGREAILRPEIVLEVGYAEIQRSPKYDSGYALRFPRFKRIRHDLDPTDAATLDRIERLYDAQR